MSGVCALVMLTMETKRTKSLSVFDELDTRNEDEGVDEKRTRLVEKT